MQRLLSFASVALFWAFFAASVSAQTLKPVAAAVQQYADQGGKFRLVDLFKQAPANDAALEVVTQAQFLRLDLENLAELVSSEPEAIVLSLPSAQGTVEIELLKTQLVAPDFQVVTSESMGRAVQVDPGVHYRGVVRGHANSIAAFSFFDGEMMGMFSDERAGNQVLGRLEVKGNTTEYILYNDTDLRASNPFTCQVLDPSTDDLDIQPGETAAVLVNGCVRVYLEADYELYQNKGSVNNTTNYLNGLFNQVATMYANETISTVVSNIFIWTTPDSYSNTSSSTALNQFKTTRPDFNGDIGHLISLGGQNIGGVAWLDVLCDNNYNYAYSNIYSTYQNVPVYSWTVMVVTHEMGHNCGSNHTQWCGWSGGALDNCYATEGGCAPGPAPTNGGTVMSYCHLTSYGINLANGFGTQPGNKIRSEVSGATCLPATCGGGGSCGTPGGLSATAITQLSATVNWASVSGATSYNLQWKASSASTWITVSGLTGTSYNLVGLLPSTTYNYKVQAVCNGTSGTYSSTASFTTLALPPCPEAYEPNNTIGTAKVIPVNTLIKAQINNPSDQDWNRFSNTSATPNIKIVLTSLPANYNVKLFRNSTLLATSQNNGTTNEQIIYNTTIVSNSYYAQVYGVSGAFNNTQCYSLTVSLKSTAWVLGEGDERDNETEIEIPVTFVDAGFGMFPNPADELLRLEFPVVETESTVSVRLFDVAGKLMLQNQGNYSDVDNRMMEISLSGIANGVYFVEVRNGDQLHTRKLVVQH